MNTSKFLIKLVLILLLLQVVHAGNRKGNKDDKINDDNHKKEGKEYGGYRYINLDAPGNEDDEGNKHHQYYQLYDPDTDYIVGGPANPAAGKYSHNSMQYYIL